jgi:hypothetical protein
MASGTQVALKFCKSGQSSPSQSTVATQVSLSSSSAILTACLDHGAKRLNFFFAKESYQFEVLNEVYLQNFLHRWVVNRETNLMMLINP